MVILETLGNGVEQQYGFDHTWIRTDYRFQTVEEAQRIVEFFFGQPSSSRGEELKLTVLPEGTGSWWRRL